jgi:hypothetical protein
VKKKFQSREENRLLLYGRERTQICKMRSILLISLVLALAVTYVTGGTAPTTVTPAPTGDGGSTPAPEGTTAVPGGTTAVPSGTTVAPKEDTTGGSSANLGSLATVALATLLGRLFI